MPDITMCVNISCPVKHICYRNTAQECEYWQSWARFAYNANVTYIDGETDPHTVCDHYMEE